MALVQLAPALSAVRADWSSLCPPLAHCGIHQLATVHPVLSGLPHFGAGGSD